MGKFSEKCKKIFHGKKSAPKGDADKTQSLKPQRTREILRKVKRSLSRSVNTNTDTIVVPSNTDHSTEAPDAQGSDSMDTVVKDVSPSEDRAPQQTTGGQPDFTPEPAPVPVTSHNDVQPEQKVSEDEAHPPEEESCFAAAPEASQPPECTVILSPHSVVESPNTTNGDSRVRPASSCYSTPTPKSRFYQTPETAQSPESVYLRTPHDRNSYVKLLDDSFRCSNPAETPDRSSTACAPLGTTTNPFGIFERSVGSGPEAPDAFSSLGQVLAGHAEPKKQEASVPTEGASASQPTEQPAHDAADNVDQPRVDKVSIKSDTPSA
ncbi:MAG: hypothetical protein Q9226_002025 [Calogaya cf. arnoldii]